MQRKLAEQEKQIEKLLAEINDVQDQRVSAADNLVDHAAGEGWSILTEKEISEAREMDVKGIGDEVVEVTMITPVRRRSSLAKLGRRVCRAFRRAFGRRRS